MSVHLQRRAAFTLIEIMIVVGILAMVLAMGAPSFIQAMRKDPLRKAAGDVMDGCTQARAEAILAGVPAELVIEAGTGQVFVERTKNTGPPNRDYGSQEEPQEIGAKPVFQEHLDPHIAVRLLYVNLKDKMESDQARVRFYPNGTSDEFTIILQSTAGGRKISLDCVTGLPDLELIP